MRKGRSAGVYSSERDEKGNITGGYLFDRDPSRPPDEPIPVDPPTVSFIHPPNGTIIDEDVLIQLSISNANNVSILVNGTLVTTLLRAPWEYLLDISEYEGETIIEVIAEGEGGINATSTEIIVEHEEEEPVDPPEPLDIHSLWTGAVSEDTFKANVQLTSSDSVRLVVSVNQDLSNPIESLSVQAKEHSYEGDTYRWAILEVSGLSPDTQYYYGARSENKAVSELQGKFRTLPIGEHSFAFGTASCNETGMNTHVFEEIENQDLDFFIHTGDFGYPDVGINNVGPFYANHTSNFSAPRQKSLWSSLPVYYMFDDHDYGPNNSWSSSPSRLAALEAYREWVPSAELANPIPTEGVYHAFTRGRIRFILTDLRSYRSDPTGPDNEGKTILGPEQKAWFKHELLNADAMGLAICWVNTTPWNATNHPDGHGGESDSWSNWGTEQQELADFITNNGLGNKMFIISGDMHALAFDDGTNAPGGIPVIQAAPLHKSTSRKGGPYTHGPFTQSNAYGKVTVDDTGEAITVRYEGISVSEPTGSVSTLIDETFELHPGVEDVTAPVLSNIDLVASGATSLLGSVETDTLNGNVYILVNNSTSTPSVQQIKSEGFSISANVERIEFPITGLTTGTEYFIHAVQESANGIDSNVLTSNGAIPEESAAPTPIIRLDASDESTLELTDGNRVRLWHSKGSLPGIVAEQSNSGLRPITGEATINGVNLLRMADPNHGVNNRYIALPNPDWNGITLHPDSSQQWSVTLAYVSYEIRSSGGDRNVLYKGDHFKIHYNATGQVVRLGGSGGNTVATDNQPLFPELRLITVTWDGENARVLYNQGVMNVASIGTGEDIVSELSIGSGFSDVAIAQVDIYDYALTENEILTLHSSIGSKWENGEGSDPDDEEPDEPDDPPTEGMKAPDEFLELQAWYDFTDLSNLFQDEVGTVPCTSTGDPIRHIKDRTGNHDISNPNPMGYVYVDSTGTTGVYNFNKDDLVEFRLDANTTNVTHFLSGWAWEHDGSYQSRLIGRSNLSSNTHRHHIDIDHRSGEVTFGTPTASGGILTLPIDVGERFNIIAGGNDEGRNLSVNGVEDTNDVGIGTFQVGVIGSTRSNESRHPLHGVLYHYGVILDRIDTLDRQELNNWLEDAVGTETPILMGGVTLYVDYENGDDTNSGTSEDQAWKHSPGDANATDRVPQYILLPGDTIVFKGGVAYEGAITDASKMFSSENGSITIDGSGDNYGTGRAILDGGKPITEWTFDPIETTPNDEQIYSATLPEGSEGMDVNAYQGEQRLHVARLPAASDPYDSENLDEFFQVPLENWDIPSNSFIDLDNLGELEGTWEHTYLMVYRTQNNVNMVKVTNYDPSAGEVTYDPSGLGSYEPMPHEGTYRYTIVNHPGAIRQPGQYYVDLASREIKLVPYTVSNDELSPEVRVSVHREGISLSKPYITVRGIQVQNYSVDDTAPGTNTSHGIILRGDQNEGHLIEDCRVRWIHSAHNRGAITVEGSINAIIRECEVLEISHNRGILSSNSNGTLIENNHVHKVNGTGIMLIESEDGIIRENLVEDSYGVHSNGLSVYQGAHRALVMNNTVNVPSVALTTQDSEDITIAGNVLISDNSSYTYADWAGDRNNGVRLVNNVILMRTPGNQSTYISEENSSTSYLYNNVLDGTTGYVPNENRSHNVYTRLGWRESPEYGWGLTETESQADRNEIFEDWGDANVTPTVPVGVMALVDGMEILIDDQLYDWIGAFPVVDPEIDLDFFLGGQGID